MMRYTAGELARVLGVSARTVRFYDEKGILAPVGHSESGYRIYDETSVEKLQKILMLRFLDFSLEQIRGIMGEGDGQDVRQSLKEQERLLVERKEHMERVLTAVREAQEEGEDSLWENLRHIVEITREKEAVIEQYRNDDNLNNRISIHDYSTAKIGFYPWMLEKLQLQPGMKILEIGCGNAAFWKYAAAELPENLEIHLTDFSAGMLERAEEAVEKIQEDFPEKHLKFVLAQKDAENFSYPEKDFHRVMANHMLYHLKREKRPALYQAIRSLLNPKGIFSCSLIGREHNRELHDLLREYYPMIEIPSEGFDIFLETAAEELQEYFPQAEVWEQENDLLVPDAELIYNYVASYSPEAAGILKKDKARFLERVQAQMNAHGFMYIHKSTGVVICRQE